MLYEQVFKYKVTNRPYFLRIYGILSRRFAHILWVESIQMAFVLVVLDLRCRSAFLPLEIVL